MLITHNDIHKTQEQMVSRFIGGLKLQLQNWLNQFDPVSVSEAHQRALSFELNNRHNSSHWTSSNNRNRSNIVPLGDINTEIRDSTKQVVHTDKE